MSGSGPDSIGENGERDWIADLRDAACTFDWDRVHEISEEYVRHLAALTQPDANEVKGVLQFLREHLRRDDLRHVADAALALGLGQDSTVRLQYAQALVDSGGPSGARLVYRDVDADAAAPEDDRVEAAGGIGRCEKQLFVATLESRRRAGHLQRSVEAYGDAYRGAPWRYWHGINLAAMLARAARDGIRVPDIPDAAATARTTATDVLETVTQESQPGGWEKATQCEALIALSRYQEAEASVAAFVNDPGTTAFMIGAFLRQLLEIWELDTRTAPGTSLLPVLRSALLERHGGAVLVQTEDVRQERVSTEPDPRLEKVLGLTRYQSLSWYRKGLERCRAVARIETQVEDGVGTGFLVRGPDLCPGLPDRVLVTNAHVVPEGLEFDECVVAFHGLDADAGGPTSFDVRRVIWSQPSADPHLDTTILELRGTPPPNVEPMPLAPKLPSLTRGAQRAYVIGHPRGLEQPQFSLQDNALLDWDDRLVHYRSPTEGGSSGSPVFNGEWRVIGLHHAGSFETSRLKGRGGTYAANEAISLPAIRVALQENPPTP
jgi:V8-like Glu-specific endopeptidase